MSAGPVLHLLFMLLLALFIQSFAQPSPCDGIEESRAVPEIKQLCDLRKAAVDLQMDVDQRLLMLAGTDNLEKRKNEFMRYGRKNEFMRYGRKNEFMRYGKRKNEFMRYGKRKNEFMRYGKRKNEFMRYGK